MADAVRAPTMPTHVRCTSSKLPDMQSIGGAVSMWQVSWIVCLAVGHECCAGLCGGSHFLFRSSTAKTKSHVWRHPCSTCEVALRWPCGCLVALDQFEEMLSGQCLLCGSSEAKPVALRQKAGAWRSCFFGERRFGFFTLQQSGDVGPVHEPDRNGQNHASATNRRSEWPQTLLQLQRWRQLPSALADDILVAKKTASQTPQNNKPNIHDQPKVTPKPVATPLPPLNLSQTGKR